ncbi:MAG: T9SS type A sorting domain-containing protein [bacterium]
MNRCTEVPPETTRAHYWFKSYAATDTFVGYAEGWPSLFAGVVSGNIYDVNTLGIIGDPNDTTGYYNIENPWDFRMIPPFPNPADSFEGGPYCEGAVCGALWDICDATGEIPYPSYPDSLNGVWFPDTALADSLTMFFDEVWNITDNYKYLGHHCWTIYDFLRGWGNYHYDHQFRLNQIVLHHRILWDVPAAPRGLQARYEGSIPGVVLTWLRNSEPDLYKYFIYRKIDHPDRVFRKIGAPFPPLDTTFTDTNVEIGKSYWYAATAMDSSFYESEFSDSVLIRLALHEEVDNPAGTGYNNAPRIIRFLHRSRGYNLLLAFSSKDSVKSVSSSNEGVTWSQSQVIAQGQFPTLLLDSANIPCCIFSRWVVQAGEIGSAQLYWTKYLNNHWTTPYLLYKIDSIMGPPELKIPVPSADIDSKDTIHILWITGIGKEYPHWFGVYYGNLYAGDTSPFFNYTTIDTLSVYESPCPSLTVDNQDIIHIAYEIEFGGPTIRYRYRENGIWSEKPKPDTITQANGCYYPDIESFGDRIYLVWDYQWPDTSVAHSICCRIKTSLGWDSIKPVYQPLPDYKFGRPVNVGGWHTIWANQDIYYSRFNGATWSAPETVKVTPEISRHPTALFRQDLDDTCLYIAWTEGDSAPYHIEFVKITVPAVPKYYGDLGQPVQSQYCLHRDGYWIFGAEPYKTMDWGYNNLKYRFTGLDPQKEYRLDIAYYFANQPFEGNLVQLEAEEGLKGVEKVDEINYGAEDEGVRPSKDGCYNKENGSEVPILKKPETDDEPRGIGRIMQTLVVDGVDLDTLFITPNKLVRKSVWLRGESYRDGEIIVDILKIKGKRVVCSEIGLYEFPKEDIKTIKASGPMGEETSISRPFSFERIYPNPTKGFLKIRFSSPDERKVIVKLYDISGRLVQKEKLCKVKIGSNEILLRPKGLSSGIYFVQLETDNYQKIEKIIYLR